MEPTLPPPVANVKRWLANWDKAAAALIAEPGQWLLLAHDIPAEAVTRLRAGQVGPLAGLHPHVQYQLRRGGTDKRHVYRGELWAFHTPGVACRSEVERLARVASEELLATAPEYPPLPV